MSCQTQKKIKKSYFNVYINYDMYCYLNMIEAFKKSIKKIFKDSIIYDNLSSDTNLVIYLNYMKSGRL